MRAYEGSTQIQQFVTREIRISDAQDIFRVMYVAKFEEAVYVLHCFQKKSKRDLKALLTPTDA